jgi:single-stranded DNA-binding protein
MTSLNCVILTGKVITQPRRHYRPDGSPVIQFPLELNHSEDQRDHILNHKDIRLSKYHSYTGPAPYHSGAGQRGRNRVNIVAFGKLAEFKLDLLQSGQHLMVIGRLNQRCWKTPEGRNRTLTEVIATDLRTIEEKNTT